MATTYLGSARIDERGKATGGKVGDQKQTSTPDYKGEVSMQPYYLHSKDWDVIRATDEKTAKALAKEMTDACNNKNIGYNQSDRYGVVKQVKAGKHLKGISTAINADCSSLTRACIIAATGKDPGDFTTADARSTIVKTGKFKYAGKITKNSKESIKACLGDILCTRTKGHIVIVTSGDSAFATKTETSSSGTSYFRRCSDYFTSFVDALNSIGAKSSMEERKKIAKANGILSYSGSASDNTSLLNKLKKGTLRKP